MDKQLPVSAWPEWKIVEKIGEGSFGKVYKARRTEQGKTFYSAIKVITIPSNAGELSSVRSENPDEQSVKEYFYSLVEECIQEVNTMEYFRGNSHVVSVEDYKVMEYLDDIDIPEFRELPTYKRVCICILKNDYCAGRALTEEDVIHLGIDLCKALEYCQCQNIIHRDIKPENIFVSRFGEFKLGDFGIARELDRTMSGLSKKGTFSYMAPEMYRGEAYDARVDIYSLGIVLYKLRNHNRLPFISLKKQLITYRDKEEALNRRMAGEKLPVPAEAGEAFAEVILKACAYDRHDRYESAEEFRMALEQILYPGQPEMQEIRKPAITPDFEGSGKIFPEQEEEPEGTRVLKRTDPKARIHGEYSSKNRKPTKRKKKFEPLFAAAVIMVIAVCIVVSVFIWLLKENAELQKLKQSVTETVQSAENKQLQETLEKIQSQATEISDNLNDYSWIGSEDEGKISYLRQKDDGSWQVMKILIYPSLSQDGYYQEYYYWNNELFFAYIWADNNTMSDLKDGEQKIDRYYYEDGKLIRWIDDKNRCHDNETDSEEYVTRGEKYWDYADEYKTQLNLSDDSTSAS